MAHQTTPEHSKATSFEPDLEKHPGHASHGVNEQLEDTFDKTYETQEDGKLNIQTILAVVALMGQFNCYIMTLLIPSTTLSYINADLGPDPNYTWITVFLAARCEYHSSLLGIIGCLVGATGQSIDQMIASGAIFGIASGFQEMSYACLQEILPNKYRMVGVGCFDLSLVIAFMSPIISYAFIAYQSISWRGAYWYMFSFHTIMSVVLFFFYKPPDFYMKHRNDGKTKRQLLGELDYVGILLFTAAGTLFLLGVNFGGRQYPWSSPTVIAPIVVGFACYVALGLYETRSSLKYPLLPPRLFREIRGFVMVIVVCFVGGMLYYSMNVLWPRQSQTLFVPATEPIMRGVYATIFSFGTLLGGIIMIFICSRVNHERWQLVVFMILQTALIGSLASVGIADRAQAIVTIFLGAAAVTPPQLVSFTMLSLNLEDQTDILAGTFRLLGGAIATAIYSAILSSRFASALPQYVNQVIQDTEFQPANAAALMKATALNTAAAYKAVPGITQSVIEASHIAYKLAYVQAFKLVYLVAIGFGGAAIIAAFCTRSTDVRLKNNKRAVRLKNEGQIDGQALPSSKENM